MRNSRSKRASIASALAEESSSSNAAYTLSSTARSGSSAWLDEFSVLTSPCVTRLSYGTFCQDVACFSRSEGRRLAGD